MLAQRVLSWTDGVIDEQVTGLGWHGAQRERTVAIGEKGEEMDEMTAGESKALKKKGKVLAKYSSRLTELKEHFSDALDKLRKAGETVLKDVVATRPNADKHNPEIIYYIAFTDKHVCILRKETKIFTFKTDDTYVKDYDDIALRTGTWRMSPVFRVILGILTFGFGFLAPASAALAQIGVAEKGKRVWFAQIPRHRFDPDLDTFNELAEIVRSKGGKVTEDGPAFKPLGAFGTRQTEL
jgi:hypothetical protein